MIRLRVIDETRYGDKDCCLLICSMHPCAFLSLTRLSVSVFVRKIDCRPSISFVVLNDNNALERMLRLVDESTPSRSAITNCFLSLLICAETQLLISKIEKQPPKTIGLAPTTNAI